jgi:hypothetical protein
VSGNSLSSGKTAIDLFGCPDGEVLGNFVDSRTVGSPTKNVAITLKVDGNYIPIGSSVWDPGRIAAGGGATSPDIALPGANLGDFVLASAPYDIRGLVVSCYVSAKNVARVRIQNGTGRSRPAEWWSFSTPCGSVVLA